MEKLTISGNNPAKSHTGIVQFLNLLRRFSIWCIINFAAWPIARPFIRHFHLFDFIFLVYPGTESDINAYVPSWFQRVFKNLFPISVIGVVSPAQNSKYGLIATLAQDPETLSRKQLERMQTKAKKLAKASGADSIALAGRLPSIFLANRIPLNPPFLKGDRGAVFTVTESLFYVLRNEHLSHDTPIGVMGIGFLGGRVLKHLHEEGCKTLIGVDPRVQEPHENNGVTLTSDPTLLKDCKVIILITAKGSDIAGTLQLLRKDVVIIDDTHPQLPFSLAAQIRQRGGEVYKVALGMQGVQLIPQIPGYSQGALPGCVVEALVNSQGQCANQLIFNSQGRKLGLRPIFTP